MASIFSVFFFSATFVALVIILLWCSAEKDRKKICNEKKEENKIDQSNNLFCILSPVFLVHGGGELKAIRLFPSPSQSFPLPFITLHVWNPSRLVSLKNLSPTFWKRIYSFCECLLLFWAILYIACWLLTALCVCADDSRAPHQQMGSIQFLSFVFLQKFIYCKNVWVQIYHPNGKRHHQFIFSFRFFSVRMSWFHLNK